MIGCVYLYGHYFCTNFIRGKATKATIKGGSTGAVIPMEFWVDGEFLGHGKEGQGCICIEYKGLERWAYSNTQYTYKVFLDLKFCFGSTGSTYQGQMR